MGRIKALLRSVFRYRLISAFFIISQLVMFYAVFGVLSIYNKAYAKQTVQAHRHSPHAQTHTWKASPSV